ncbi:MAG TPA: HAD family hydrolase [Thermoplasmata archaeon]|nr:HAD family hydrolase [Thermoplasmata archaeon]
MTAFAWRLVTVDIDGTLTLVHGWRRMAEAFHRVPEFEASNRRFFAHEIGEDPHLADLLDLANGHTVAEVEEVLASTPRLSGIAEGVATLRGLGARVALLSHNPPYVCSWYQRRFGFDDFDATPGSIVVDGVLGRPGPVHADKRGGVVRLAGRAGVPLRAVVHVGDGWSDAEVFREVGGGIAVNAPLPEVRAAASLAVNSGRFDDVVAAIRSIAPPP